MAMRAAATGYTPARLLSRACALALMVVAARAPRAATAAATAAATPTPTTGGGGGAPAPGVLLRPHGPTNVTYDSRSLLINGTRLLWVSGGVHYARHSPHLWRSVLTQASRCLMPGSLDLLRARTRPVAGDGVGPHVHARVCVWLCALCCVPCVWLVLPRAGPPRVR